MLFFLHFPYFFFSLHLLHACSFSACLLLFSCLSFLIFISCIHHTNVAIHSPLWVFCSFKAVYVMLIVLTVPRLCPCPNCAVPRSVLLVCILPDSMFAVQIHAKLSAAATARDGGETAGRFCPSRPLAVQVGIGDNAVCVRVQTYCTCPGLYRSVEIAARSLCLASCVSSHLCEKDQEINVLVFGVHCFNKMENKIDFQ